MTPDERALYAALDFAFVPPELRTGDRALAPAAHAELRALLEPSDIRGAVHCHTVYSDGKDEIEVMARAAAALGMRYITITDHSPSAHYAGGVPLGVMTGVAGQAAVATRAQRPGDRHPFGYDH